MGSSSGVVVTPPTPKSKSLERVMSMNGGRGECSYDRMSVVQAYALQILHPFLTDAVRVMSLPTAPTPLRIADFGSATGRNAIAYVDFLVRCIRKEYEEVGRSTTSTRSRSSLVGGMPEVQAFFNDLPGSDFNTMFGLLPTVKNFFKKDDEVEQLQENQQETPGREYFVAGVPGSFYGRLFPKDSLHFAICMHCLHWISQVPAEVTDPASELYNRGSCWIMGGNPAIARAFANQSQIDFRKFLQCRAAELASGGILQCFLSGRADLDDPTNQTIPERRHRFLAGPDFESAWDDLIAEGTITAETRDSFNLPIYIPHVEEVRASISASGGFEILRLELLEEVALYPEEERLRMVQHPSQCAKFYSSWVRALVEPLIVVHMGAAATRAWFVLHERRLLARCRGMQGSRHEMEEYKFLTADFLLIVLKKI